MLRNLQIYLEDSNDEFLNHGYQSNECYKIDFNYDFGQKSIKFASFCFTLFVIWSVKLQFVIGN